MTTASIDELFAHNQEWAARMERDRPGFFTALLAQQKNSLSNRARAIKANLHSARYCGGGS